MEEWSYVVKTDSVLKEPIMKEGKKLEDGISAVTEKLIAGNKEHMRIYKYDRELEIAHIFSTSVDDRVLVTVVSKGKKR